MDTPADAHTAEPHTTADAHAAPQPPDAVLGTHDAAERDALTAAAAHLGLEIGTEILDGGSPARVHRARAADGTEVVVKVLAARPGAVDGHDLDSFRGKLRQLQHIRHRAPRLGARYLPVLHSAEGAGWAAYTTPHYPSQDLAACLRQGPGDTEAFLARHDAVATDLFLHGYGGDGGRLAAPGRHLADVHIGRFLRRLPVLQASLPEVGHAEELVVNGVPCRAPGPLLRHLLNTEGDLLDRLGPTRLGFPAHGDANIRNVLTATAGDAPGDFRIIDPRGSTEPWDPVYDLAKTLFSLTVWDPMLRLGIEAHRSAGGGSGRRAEYTVRFRHPVYPGYRAAAHRFLPHLQAGELPGALFADDPRWRDRLLLTHDLHVLAEAPCRLSDRKPKPNVDGRDSPPEELALGHYLLGTLLINDLVGQLTGRAEPDADRHLALVTGGPPPR
ncbi:hypothetical protein [Allostreptomyces psammosilenae]|uniref:Aminoglycoside phosphotransferase domain-containing protein n=1 Tax=Allostreptomyces psammosilenae TaxID=1892865 RepID=A0A853A2A1_9ACTN|nr:hypothetical protein [Allostreptomyces psammosilenae]NYI07590.1 hypothetical protein [Allostreptomyces psammosilenae]